LFVAAGSFLRVRAFVAGGSGATGVAGGRRSTCVANCSRFARIAAGSVAGVADRLASRVSAIVASVAVRIPGGSGVTGGASAAVVDRRTIAVVDGRPVVVMVDGRTIAAGVSVVIARRTSAIVVDARVVVAGVRMVVSSCRGRWF
jgi:hypothetical protein